MGMTIAEKILGRKGGRDVVRPGDIVTVEVVVVMDHRVPAPNAMVAGAHVTARAFAKKFGIKRVHDVGYDQGISHQLVADLGYGIPGTVLVCSDSHTCSAGVFNCLAAAWEARTFSIPRSKARRGFAAARPCANSRLHRR